MTRSTTRRSMMGPFSPSFLPADFVIGWIRRVETIGPPIRQTHPSIKQSINRYAAHLDPKGAESEGTTRESFIQLPSSLPPLFFFSVPFSSDRPIPSTATRHMTGMPLKVPGAGWWWAGSVINPLGRPGVSTFHISLTSTGRCEQSIKSHAWQHLSIRKRRLAAIVRQ